MPTLWNLSCRVERTDQDHTPLEEYAITYGDKVVKSILKVPPEPTPFAISLVTDSYVSDGLSMFVFTDGIYQCNRNRCDLSFGDECFGGSGSCQRGGVEFRVRQKEEYLLTGECIGKAWTFMPYDTTCSLVELHDAIFTDPEQHCHSNRLHHLGMIEVFVLRCFSRNSNRYSLLDTTPSCSTSPESATSPLTCCGPAEELPSNLPLEGDGEREQSHDASASIAQHQRDCNHPETFDGSRDIIYDDTVETGADMRGHANHFLRTLPITSPTLHGNPENENSHEKLRVQIPLTLPCKSGRAVLQVYQDSVSTRSSPDALASSSNAGTRPWFGATNMSPPLTTIQQSYTEGTHCIPCQIDGEWSPQDPESSWGVRYESSEPQDNVTQCQADTGNEWTSLNSEICSTTQPINEEGVANGSESPQQSGSSALGKFNNSETGLYTDDRQHHEDRNLPKGPELLASNEHQEKPRASSPQLERSAKRHYIRYGPSERYIHNIGRPTYIDTLSKPFARFAFQYGLTTNCNGSKPSEHVASESGQPLSQDAQSTQNIKRQMTPGDDKYQEDETGGESNDDITDIDKTTSHQNVSAYLPFASDTSNDNSNLRDMGNQMESLLEGSSEDPSVLENQEAASTAHASSASAIDSNDEVSGWSNQSRSQEPPEDLRDSEQCTNVENQKDYRVGQDDSEEPCW